MSKEIAEAIVKTDDVYLNTQMATIKSSTQNGLNKIEVDSTSFSSTTNIPTKEPELINKVVEASTTLLNKLNTEIDSILNVGENYKDMDNFLADFANTNLGFDLMSESVVVTAPTTYSDINDMSDLMGLTIPTIEGYNGETGKTVIPEVKEQPKESTPVSTTPKNTSPASTTPKVTKPSTQSTITTGSQTKPSNPSTTKQETTKKDEIVEDKPMEGIVSNEIIKTEEPIIKEKDVVIENNTPKDEIIKPVSTKEEKQVVTTPTSKKVTTKRVEKYVNGEEEMDFVFQEPDEKDILEEQNTPSIVEEKIIDEYIEPEEIKIIPVEEENNKTYTPKKEDNSSKTAIGIAVGGVLAAGAAAVGYSAIKNKKEDNNNE